MDQRTSVGKSEKQFNCEPNTDINYKSRLKSTVK